MILSIKKWLFYDLLGPGKQLKRTFNPMNQSPLKVTKELRQTEKKQMNVEMIEEDETGATYRFYLSAQEIDEFVTLGIITALKQAAAEANKFLEAKEANEG
jgi:hypothetical protein